MAGPHLVSGWQVSQADRQVLGQVSVKALADKLFPDNEAAQLVKKTNELIDHITIPLYEAQAYRWDQQTLSVYNSQANHRVTQAEVHELFLKKLKECAPKDASVEEMWKEQETKCRKKLEMNIKLTLSTALLDYDLSSAPIKQLIEMVKASGGYWNEDHKSLFYKNSHIPMTQMRAIVINCLNPIAKNQRQAPFDEKENRYVTSEARMYTADEIWGSDPLACEESLQAACLQLLSEMQS